MKKALFIILTLFVMLTMNACFLLFVGDETESSSNENITTKTEKSAENYEIISSSVKTYKDSIGITWAQAIVEVENTGSSNLFLHSGTCDLEDLEGNLIASKSISVFPQIIAPGEKAFYYDEYALDTLAEPIELKIIPRPEIVKSSSKHITCTVTDISITDYALGGIKVMGRVENTSESEESLIYVAVVLFNEDSEPIGLVYTILSDGLAPGEKVGFEATALSLPSDVTADSVESYTAVAYPYQFQIDFY